MSAVRALGGAALVGSKRVRFVHLDEAGIANPDHEPYVVVAGPVINADRDWKRIEEHLSGLADEFAPPGTREEFFFHATDLFSGGKFRHHVANGTKPRRASRLPAAHVIASDARW